MFANRSPVHTEGIRSKPGTLTRQRHCPDAEAWTAAGATGLLLPDVPEEYGGGGTFGSLVCLAVKTDANIAGKKGIFMIVVEAKIFLTNEIMKGLIAWSL